MELLRVVKAGKSATESGGYLSCAVPAELTYNRLLKPTFQGFCQRSYFLCPGTGNLDLRQKRPVDVAHRKAPHLRGCFQFLEASAYPIWLGTRW